MVVMPHHAADHLLPAPIRALAISPGLALGPVCLVGQSNPDLASREIRKISSDQVELEQQRLHTALAEAIAELEVLSQRVAKTVGRQEADIFAAQQLMLADPDFLEEIQELITQQHYSSPSALYNAAEHQARELEELANEVLAARASDIRDVAARVIRLLEEGEVAHNGQTSVPTPTTAQAPVILVAHDLTPSTTASLDPQTILGICTVVGGPTTHAAIMADVLVREVDFFSIGANDLFQYTLAADRTNSRVMSLFGAYEPSVWRLIKQVARAGSLAGKTVALCGELAADPRAAPLLSRLGIHELSMSPPAVAAVKAALHQRSMAYWQAQAQLLLEAETAQEIQQLLQGLDEKQAN